MNNIYNNIIVNYLKVGHYVKLKDIANISLDKYYVSVEDIQRYSSSYTDVIVWACSKKNYKLVKYVYKQRRRIYENYLKILCSAIQTNNLNIVAFIYENMFFNIHKDDYLDVVHDTIKTGNIDIVIFVHDYIYCARYVSDHIIYDMYNANIQIRYDMANIVKSFPPKSMEYASQYGHIDILNYIYEYEHDLIWNILASSMTSIQIYEKIYKNMNMGTLMNLAVKQNRKDTLNWHKDVLSDIIY